MTFNAKEIKLCKRLDELGIGPEIREGDVILDRELDLPKIMVDEDEVGLANGFRGSSILLLSWERCREMLREKGWKLQHALDDSAGQVILEFWKFFSERTKGPEIIRWAGATDLEAILRVLVAAEE